MKGWYHEICELHIGKGKKNFFWLLIDLRSYRWLEERGEERGSWKMERGPFKNQFVGIATLNTSLIVDIVKVY
jgi:hypothetical protein